MAGVLLILRKSPTAINWDFEPADYADQSTFKQIKLQTASLVFAGESWMW